MMDCIWSSWFSIILNGTSKGFFCPSRGLRQGDLLSPFLFSLVADSLSALLSHVVWVNLVEGFKILSSDLSISYPQFTDDTIVFVKPSSANSIDLKHTLQIFELILGFKVNWRKSEIVEINVEDALLSLANILSYRVDEWSLKYLNLSLRGQPYLGRFWDPVIEKIEKRFAF